MMKGQEDLPYKLLSDSAAITITALGLNFTLDEETREEISWLRYRSRESFWRVTFSTTTSCGLSGDPR